MFSCNVLRTFTRSVAVAGAIVIGFASTNAFADSVNVFLTARTGSGDEVGVAVNLLDVGGDVKFSAEVQEIPGLIPGEGDILALWFDVASSVNLANVTHAAPYDPPSLEFKITGFEKGHDTIGSAPWGGNPNINGMPAPFDASTKYDMAIKIGSNGAPPGDYFPKISFMFTNISVADFVGGRMAARVTSIGDTGDSGKYAAWVPDNPPVVPTPSAALGGLALLGFAGLHRRKMA